MKKISLNNALLTVIAVALVSIAARPYIAPGAAHAQASGNYSYPLYFEPGTQMLRDPAGSKQVYGRVVVDMRTGKVWGFPTNTPDTYPWNPVDSKPQISHPFYLGRFAFEDIDKQN